MTIDPDPTLDALGHPTRRAILDALRQGPRPVGAISRGFDVTRPAVSQHLRVLKDAGLVTVTRDATRRLYALNPEAFDSLRGYFDEFWSVALENFKHRVEAKASRGKRSA